ncbi:DUF1145 domain-containing protein [Vibrio sp. ZSDE26]|uniref:DUF1145 domain-containing protein n=1 Tax=Vibrio amylolyticus TaxID=2847292 RepID=A0A9X2BK07_9VIBR|nr:DUF1145 domain-containing protein [Vibrio amylolyticus]MCK6265745.1 DUF1145 domain-containing protein [Vibrio amylolyticus]
MNAGIIIAKAVIAVVWGVLIYNLIAPFHYPLNLVLYIIMGFLLFTHILQTVIFSAAFSKQLKLTLGDKLSILVFGVCALIDIRNKRVIPEVEKGKDTSEEQV